MSEEFNVDYKVLKNRIIRSCKVTGKEIVDFSIDFERLEQECHDLNITPIFFGLNAHRVKPELIPYLNEYFKDSNLSWFSSSKFSTCISFICNDFIDEKAMELLNKLKTPQVDDPNDDKVNDVAELLANYPCYNATVVAYKSNNPKFVKFNKPSYLIQIRANKVIITNSNYQYNWRDMS
jgi:hypothetical protein